MLSIFTEKFKFKLFYKDKEISIIVMIYIEQYSIDSIFVNFDN